METSGRTSTVGRRIVILDQLNRNGQVGVTELSQSLGVSEVTIRNDLTQLEKKGMLLRARGGALQIKPNYAGADYPLSDKQKKHLPEKRSIGVRAAGLIEEGNTIILDSGSTTFEIARNLGNFSDLTVITNALNVATYLAENKNISVIVPGGTLRNNSMSLVGILAEKGIRNYYCDKLFLGVDGFDCDYGVSTPNLEESHLNQIMIEISKEVIVVADSSKFQKRGFALITPIEKIDTVVTDSGIPSSVKSKLDSLGIKVLIA
ncbi:MAG: DeoR/GlpR transcriptional regulator [Saprospiraceae bacterium]|nr:DeoR/GlpR transcriptional regulator [Saprospiraceae bacterium]